MVSLSGQNNASVIGANPDSTSCFIRLWWPDSDNYFDSLCSSRTEVVTGALCTLFCSIPCGTCNVH